MEIKIPEYSDYECQLFGCGDAITIRPEKGKEPNAFWRTMQYLIVGNKWRLNPLTKR